MTLPTELNGANLTYKLTNISKQVGKYGEYKLEIKLSKNNSYQSIIMLMKSKNLVQLSSVEKELIRIKSLLKNGRIQTNIVDSNYTLPSDVKIDLYTQPFNDSGVANPNVHMFFEKISSDDDKGELTIKTTFHNEGELPMSLEIILIGFMSNNYIDVNHIKNEVGSPISLNSKTVDELDALVGHTLLSEKVFDEVAIEKLGLDNVTIPIDLNDYGVDIKFKLENVSHTPNEIGKYLLSIWFTKGTIEEKTVIEISSIDLVPFPAVQIEKNRIMGLLIDGKILSSQENSELTLPEHVVIEKDVTPFLDNGVPTKGVDISFLKKSFNNKNGEVVIEVKLSKKGEKTITFDIILYGYMNDEKNTINQVRNMVENIIISENKSREELDNIVAETITPRIFDKTAMEQLGLTIEFPSDLKETELTYILTKKANNIPGYKSIYELIIFIKSGSVVEQMTTNIYSSDVSYFETELEKERILSLLTDGKIQTNIEDAINKLPSTVEIDEKTKPFEDPVINIYDVDVLFTRKYVNDVDGELTITIFITKEDEPSQSFDLILTGFQTNEIHEKKVIENAENLILPIISYMGTLTTSQLDGVVEYTKTYRILNEQLIRMLNLSIKEEDLDGVEISFKLEIEEKKPGEKGKYKLLVIYEKGLTITKKEYIIESINNVLSHTQIEKNKIISMLVDGKIETSIENASEMLPSQIHSNIVKIPFVPKVKLSDDVQYSWIIKEVDDVHGELTITLTLVYKDEESEIFEIKLSGFQSLDQNDEYIVNKVAEELVLAEQINKYPIDIIETFLSIGDSLQQVDSEIFEIFGLNINYQSISKDVILKYKLNVENAEPGKILTYNLFIYILKGEAQKVIQKIIHSSNSVLFDTQIEKEKIKSQLIDGKIETNIENASEKLPSEITTLYRPFDTQWESTRGVSILIEKIASDDIKGELLIKLIFTKENQTTETLNVILTGFNNQYEMDRNWVEIVKNKLMVEDLASKTVEELKSIECYDEMPLDEKAVQKLGFLIELDPKYKDTILHYTFKEFELKQNEPAKFLLSIRVTKGLYSSTVSFVIQSIDLVQ